MASCYCGDIHCSGESHDTLFNNMTLDEKHKNIVSRNGKCTSITHGIGPKGLYRRLNRRYAIEIIWL